MKNIKRIINWIFSDKCISCGKEVSCESFLCEKCFKEIIFIDFPYCKCCGKLLHSSYNKEMLCDTCSNYERYFNSGRSLFLYNNISKKVVMRIKKEADEHVAKVCANLLYKRYGDLIADVDTIIPVPLHFSRLLRRGFNQSSIIAKHISKLSTIPLSFTELKRIKKTDYQKNKTIEQRKNNTKGAFIAHSSCKNKRILLVDDVITTGATISECSKTLKEEGAKSVVYLTIATT
ncbi:MAG: ComF family protein [Holosporales bacterium]|jgi:ComF family protein|nr:ComF family protein [Holosporales bacterium]